MKLFIVFAACLTVGAALLRTQTNDLVAKSNRGKQLMAAGRFEEAIPIYRDLARALPHEPGALMDLGLALHMAGHEREAVGQFQEVLKLDPRRWQARLFLGAAYLAVNQPSKAVEPLEKVVRTEPSNQDARELLGNALLSAGRLEPAVEQFRRLSALNPGSPKTWGGLGRSHEALAERNFERLEKIALGSAYWLVLVADSRSKAQRPDVAFSFYREALAKAPSLRGVHAAVAGIYKETGHPDWAAIEQQRERELPPLQCGNDTRNSKEAKERNGARRSQRVDANELECDFWAGRYQELIASARHWNAVDSYYWLARAHDKLAADAYSHLTELPRSAELYELLAQIHYGERRCMEAVKDWQQALQLSPGNPYYKKELAISETCSGDYQGAQQLLEGLVRQSPDSADLNYWLGFSLLSLEKAAEALPFLEKAVEADPTVPAAHRDLARVYMRLGQSASAIPHLKAALPIDDDGSIRFQLAKAYRSTGQQSLGEEMLKEFKEIQNSQAAKRKELELERRITSP